MTPEQVNLMVQAAKNLLAHQAAGRKCDPHALRWAAHIVKANPAPKAAPKEQA